MGVGDDREASIRVFLEKVGEGFDGTAFSGDGNQIFKSGHDLRDRDIRDGSVVAIVQEWVFVEGDPSFVDTAFAEGVADPFCNHDGDHDGQDVGKGAGEFEHDNHDRDGHACCAC